MREALYQVSGTGGAVKCALCPKGCIVREGGRGLCRGRINRGGKLLAGNYGLISSMALDPIEKKPLYHFSPGSVILSIGTWGCNFRCRFCQNWEIAQTFIETGDGNRTGDGSVSSQLREGMSETGRSETGDGSVFYSDGTENSHEPDDRFDAEAGERIQRYRPEDILKLALETSSKYGNIGVAYTYSEPVVWYEFVYDTAKLIKSHGLRNILVTNGFINEDPLKELLPFIDALNIDVKAFTSRFYRECCGGELEPVLRTVEAASGCSHVEVTNLIIPGLNDTESEAADFAEWLSSISRDIPVHLSRYYPNYMLDLPPTPVETLRRARDIIKKRMRYVYLGNVPGLFDNDTLCHSCGQKLIVRSGYSVVENRIEQGRCPGCGTEIAVVC